MNKEGRATRLLGAILLATAAVGLLLLLPGGDVALAEGGSTRDLTGSTFTITPGIYITGTANVYTVTAYNGSPDEDYLDGITVTFPIDWMVTGAVSDTYDSCSSEPVDFAITGLGTNEIAFVDANGDYGEVYDYCSWSAVVTATVPMTASGLQDVAWLLSSDEWGDPPYELSGTVQLGDDEWHQVYLPLVLRDYGQKRYAVIVGVADYLNDYWAPDLEYTDDDAWDMREALIASGGFQASNINILIDSQATKSGVHSAISTWLDARENANDLVVFFFSGHGGDGGYLIPHDYNGDLSTAISDSELDGWLDGLESDAVFVAVDSCYSGDFARYLGGAAEATCKCVPAPIDAPLSSREGRSILHIGQPGRLILAASAGDESSWEYSALHNGVFSYYLVEALNTPGADTVDSNGWVSGEEAFSYLAPKVATYTSGNQHPQIDDDVPGLLDLTHP